MESTNFNLQLDKMTSAQILIKWLNQYAVRKNEPCTHVLMNGGKYYIPQEKINELNKTLAQCIKLNKGKPLKVALVEKGANVVSHSAYFVDIDDNAPNDKTIIHKALVGAIESVINQKAGIGVYASRADNSKWHIVFPNVKVDKKERKEINERVKGIQIDKSCSSLRVLGVRKWNKETNKFDGPESAYEFAGILGGTLDCQTLEKQLNMSSIQLNGINKEVKPQKIITEDIDPEIEALLNSLNQERKDNYNDWLTVGMILYNLGNHYNTWVKWSESSPKFDEDVCQTKWNSFGDGDLTIGTLKYMVKQDMGIDAYNEKFKKVNSEFDLTIKCFDRGQLGDAELFAELTKGEIFNISKKSGYYFWNPKAKLWKEDNCDYILNYVSDTLSNKYLEYSKWLSNEALKETNKETLIARNREVLKRARMCNSANYSRGVLNFLPNLCNDFNFEQRLNDNPDLLSIKGGMVVDLRTGKLRERISSDLISYKCPIKFNNSNKDEIVKFINDIMGDDQELVDYLQKVLGYAITGHTNEQKIFIMIGDGSNGKSLLFELLECILGSDYYKPMSRDVLIRNDRGKSVGAASSYLAQIKGCRLAVCSELNNNDSLNEAQVKLITSGNDSINYRELYKEESSFKPKFTPFILSNNEPSFECCDLGMRRRLIKIPFNVKFVDNPKSENEKKINRNLGKYLKENCLGSFLSWVIDGAVKWHEDKHLNPPQAVIDITNEYIEENDTLGTFVKEKFDEDANGFIKAGDTFNMYRNWLEERGERGKRLMGIREFSKEMGKRYQSGYKHNHMRVYYGLKIKEGIQEDENIIIL